MRAALESLLRARKLDATLVAADMPVSPERLAPTGDDRLDAALGGGLRRGHLSEIIGAASSGRATLVARLLAAATARGEATAIVDACDTWDPASAASHGVALERVLWVRERGRATRASAASDPPERSEAAKALKAFSLILQAGGFGVVVLDLADAAPTAIRRFPSTTWMRAARLLEQSGRDTVALLVGVERIARSSGGVTIALDVTGAGWRGASPRARLFTGVDPAPRVVRAR
jgi:RecA/RadA recombinase